MLLRLRYVPVAQLFVVDRHQTVDGPPKITVHWLERTPPLPWTSERGAGAPFMGMRPRRRPSHGLQSRIGAKNYSALTGQDTTIAVRKGGFAVLHLPFVAFTAHLAHRLDDH